MGLREAAITLLMSSAVALGSCVGETAEVKRLVPQIVAVHPFDESSFTQGLELEEEGTLLVGTGEYGESRIYRTTLAGQELASARLEPERFGEGVTRHGDHIWQLTWRGQVAVKREADTLEELDRAAYTGEGWGLCSTGEELIMSDGTDTLRRLDPDTFRELGRFRVTVDGEPQEGLNELECVNGDIYANIFLTTDIVRIDAAGTVTAVIDAAGLPNNAEPAADHVLNGIAHVPDTDRFLLGGKRWPDLYEVVLVPAQ